jgi:hypothetical protein
MEVYRLINKKHPIELSGIGAARFGARWNSKGTEIVYTAQSRALAMAEVAVHLTLATLPSSFLMIIIQIPDDIEVIDCNQKKLEIGWNEFPENTTTQIIGDAFIQKKEYCVMKVPSAVVRGDFNYLLNPYHSDFKRIKITHHENFPFDKRIFK